MEFKPMQGPRTYLLILGSLFALVLSAGPLTAGDLYDKKPTPTGEAPLPRPAEVTALSAFPTRIDLKGSDAAAQLIVTAKVGGTRLVDLSGHARYEVADRKIVRVSSSGRVIPLADGNTEITAMYGKCRVKIPVVAEAVDESLPINFGNQVVPIFTKLGCNGGGCHGKASGQNGFKLSLLGFEPDVDYSALVKEARGRRVFPASPEHSLLLLKATGTIAHGGGKRMEVDSDEYKLIRRWIASGLPFGSKDDPQVTRISIYPEKRILEHSGQQQVAVLAHYSDGTVEDVTRRAQYESNETEVAVVDAAGLVRTLDLSGQAAIMARYQGQMTVFRATVPLGRRTPAYTFEPLTVVDRYTHKKWQELGIVPSEMCGDAEFIRRASLDITGTLPTPAQVAEFLADEAKDKRDKLIDHLLETPEYAYYFANKWADVLRVKRGRNQNNRAFGTFVFHNWIRKAMANDKPYDEFVRDILCAVGDEGKSPTTVWYKDLRTPDEFVDNLAQVFLGQRLACANCHHHPYEKWSQDDYWGLAAFYGRLARKVLPVAGLSLNNQQQQRLVLYTRPGGNVINKRTKRVAPLKPLDQDPITVDDEEDPRQKLVDWMVDAKNPFFARAVANRYWAHFFGRGIVDPLDDMRVTNPPSNPELLDALATDLVKNKYSLKSLIRTICKSRTYQLSSMPNEFNKSDKQAYSRYYPKRMAAEVLFDAVCQVTDSPSAFGNLPQDRHAPRRAIMLPDESYQSYFLDVFGRPQRISACECERVSDANLAQALHLLNSNEVQGKLSRPGGRVDTLVKDSRPDEEKVAELFLWAFARRPTERQLRVALEHIDRHAKDKRVAYENILWALINTKEFVFIK
jgi:hypothetical protein